MHATASERATVVIDLTAAALINSSIRVGSDPRVTQINSSIQSDP
jgi:hypothetical protein